MRPSIKPLIYLSMYVHAYIYLPYLSISLYQYLSLFVCQSFHSDSSLSVKVAGRSRPSIIEVRISVYFGLTPSLGRADASHACRPEVHGDTKRVCVSSVWVPCVAIPSGGGSSVGPPLCVGPLCGSPVWVPCAGPLCGSPVWVPSVWVPCVGPLCGSLVALRSMWHLLA